MKSMKLKTFKEPIREMKTNGILRQTTIIVTSTSDPEVQIRE
jgi:hypothetical protein